MLKLLLPKNSLLNDFRNSEQEIIQHFLIMKSFWETEKQWEMYLIPSKTKLWIIPHTFYGILN